MLNIIWVDVNQMFPWRIQLYYTASTDYNQDYIFILELWITSKTVIYRESGKIVLNPTGLSKGSQVLELKIWCVRQDISDIT